jgi:hypothetical protein
MAMHYIILQQGNNEIRIPVGRWSVDRSFPEDRVEVEFDALTGAFDHVRHEGTDLYLVVKEAK